MPNGVTDLSGVIAAFATSVQKGRLAAGRFPCQRHERLLHVPHSDGCAMNQVPCSLADPAIEHDLLA